MLDTTTPNISNSSRPGNYCVCVLSKLCMPQAKFFLGLFLIGKNCTGNNCFGKKGVMHTRVSPTAFFFWKMHLDAKLKQVFCRAGRYLPYPRH